MKILKISVLALVAAGLTTACDSNTKPETKTQNEAPKMEVNAADTMGAYGDRFADLQLLSYEVPGFDQLNLKEKKLAYYLYQAALCGRDIIYDQNYKHNLPIRRTLETVVNTYGGNKDTAEWKKFMVYTKRVWFANGIHHHYSNDKIMPTFTYEYFLHLLKNSDNSQLPLEGKSVDAFAEFYKPVMFDKDVDFKKVDKSKDIDNVEASAVNFYEGVSQKEVDDFYGEMMKKDDKTPISYGLNSKMVKENGNVVQKTWKVGGMYSAAIEKITYWLNKAVEVAENPNQKDALQKLVKYYQTGDLKDWDAYNIAWVKDVDSKLDVVNGFIEVYNDPIGKRGSFESVVSMKDLEATKRIAAIGREAQWFEDHSPIMAEHKKKNVKGITAKVITVIVESGDAAPSTPIGINLPNANWIREQHGSKSVSLGNIVRAYDANKSKNSSVDEFYLDKAAADRLKQYGSLAGDLHTDMHEVIGHASGKINPGIGTPDATLKIYANTLEEGRADLVALYYIMDNKLVEMGVMPNLDVAKAEYDRYIMNGMMLQLNRLEPGKDVEEAHMRNRQLIAQWVYEKGKKDNVIEKTVTDGKTYFKVNDYEKLRTLFGELLKEIQRIKSEGDFKAATNLVETYAVKADQDLVKEVRDRYAKLNTAPYSGFIQARLVPVMDGDNITDVKVEYPKDFVKQMLEYAKDYSYLPNKN